MSVEARRELAEVHPRGESTMTSTTPARTTTTTHLRDARQLVADYFKKSHLLGVELLTVHYQIPPDRLYATYFEGNEALGLPADTEARDIWLQFLPAERILTAT